MIDTGRKDGIQGHLTVLGHDPLHYVLVYIQVEDLSSSLDRLSALGGAVVVPPVQLPDGRRFAWIRDPEGNTIGIITPPPTN
jgi:predicted enzyme related to lactoylglutathione lyase